MLRYFSFIFRSSLRNRRRSLLTIASIAVSLCLLGVLMAMYTVLFLSTDATPAQALRLVVHHRVSITQPLPVSFEQRIRQVPGVRDAMIWQWFGGVYKDARDPKNFFARLVVEPDHFFNIRSELTMPEDEKQQFIHMRSGCIVGRKLANRLNFKIGDKVNIQGDIFPVNPELTIVGIYDDPTDTEEESLYFNYQYLREALGGNSQQDLIGALSVEADNPNDVPKVAQTIDDMFANSPYPTKTESEKAFQLSFIAFLGNLKLFLAAICGAVTFTILLVSANTISMSVRERVREVGVLKTLGFTRGSILGIIIGEAVVIAGIGGVLGSLLAGGLCTMVRNFPFTAAFFRNLFFTPGVAATALAAAIVIGIISSFVPAYSASRTSIIDSLRYAG
ncbi:MAG TPA: FtsX-like permease family protein [Bryobacteraceae bacterium]|nr:FtsX-like permease family protein [Bryobacteraceae bacterium]